MRPCVHYLSRMTAQPYPPSAFNAQILADQDLLYTLASALLGDERRAEAAVEQACQDAYRRLCASNGLAAREALLGCLVKACAPGLHSRMENWRGWGPRRAARGQPGRLTDCLERLPFRPRAAVALVDLAGLTYAEAARVLGCSPREVRSSLASGRQCLARLIPTLSTHSTAG